VADGMAPGSCGRGASNPSDAPGRGPHRGALGDWRGEAALARLRPAFGEAERQRAGVMRIGLGRGDAGRWAPRFGGGSSESALRKPARTARPELRMSSGRSSK
jgi:hypothetical protein